jgi:hypothetical protein
MELKTDSTKSIKSFIEEYQCPHGIIISNSEKIQMRSERVIEIPAIYL